MVPNAAIRNLIREDKIHQIYSSMQVGQESSDADDEQSLASLHLRRLITLDDALGPQLRSDGAAQLISQGQRCPPGRAAVGGESLRAALAREGGVEGRCRSISGRRATRQGSLKKGEIEAMNEAAVMAQLRSQMLLPVTVKEKSKDVSEYLPFLKQGIKTRELVIFTRQFATMIDAGLPLVQCLDILGNQQPNKTFQSVIRDVKADVEQGSTFADALRKHPKAYDELYVTSSRPARSAASSTRS
jgi:hypothetical protein